LVWPNARATTHQPYAAVRRATVDYLGELARLAATWEDGGAGGSARRSSENCCRASRTIRHELRPLRCFGRDADDCEGGVTLAVEPSRRPNEGKLPPKTRPPTALRLVAWRSSAMTAATRSARPCRERGRRPIPDSSRATRASSCTYTRTTPTAKAPAASLDFVRSSPPLREIG